MSCDFDNDRLEAYALSLLDGDDRKEVATHTGCCSDCRNRVIQIRRTVQILDGAFDEDPPDWLLQKTAANLNRSGNKTFTWKRWIGIPVYAGIAAVVIMVLFQSGLHSGRNRFQGRNTHGIVGVDNGIRFDNKGQHRTSGENARTGGFLYGTSTRNDGTVTPRDGDDISVDRINGAIGSVFGLFFENPVYDRSIYRELGVSEEVAALLL